MKINRWDDKFIKEAVLKENYELINYFRDTKSNIVIECLCKNKRYYKFKLKSLVNEGKKCRCCSCSYEESFIFKNPKEALFWDWNKNKGANPKYCRASSHNKYWFVCSNNHNFNIGLDSITNSHQWCPYCSGKYATNENNFVSKNPQRAKYWDYERNKTVNPKELLPSVPYKKYWFICEKGHSFKMSLNAITSKKQWCPTCSRSKGEKRLINYLNEKGIKYQEEKMYFDLIGLGGGNLSYDFYLPKYNLLIEYQGEQHEKYIKGLHTSKDAFKKQQEHDRRKREYTKQNNIELLEIWYHDYDNIEQILNNKLKIMKG